MISLIDIKQNHTDSPPYKTDLIRLKNKRLTRLKNKQNNLNGLFVLG
jgi:hypothetical protein